MGNKHLSKEEIEEKEYNKHSNKRRPKQEDVDYFKQRENQYEKKSHTALLNEKRMRGNLDENEYRATQDYYTQTENLRNQMNSLKETNASLDAIINQQKQDELLR